MKTLKLCALYFRLYAFFACLGFFSYSYLAFKQLAVEQQISLLLSLLLFFGILSWKFADDTSNKPDFEFKTIFVWLFRLNLAVALCVCFCYWLSKELSSWEEIGPVKKLKVYIMTLGIWCNFLVLKNYVVLCF